MARYRLAMIFFFFVPFFSEGTFVGNFAAPALSREGLVFSENTFFHLRLSYVYDDLYKGDYGESEAYRIKERSHLGVLTCNLFHYVDLYGIAGFSNLEIKEPSDTLYADRFDFSWGAGASAVLFHWDHFFLGVDGKYYHARVHPSYVQAEGKACSIVTPLSYIVEDIQGALGIAYQSDLLTPYIGVSYIYSTATPLPHTASILIPDYDANPALLSQSALFIKERWGLVLGTSIGGKGAFSLNLEARFFNQYAFQVSGSLCF
ncbi:MAG: hypothetical protein WCP39_01390 [Chlamydiota bacterium]